MSLSVILSAFSVLYAFLSFLFIFDLSFLFFSVLYLVHPSNFFYSSFCSLFSPLSVCLFTYFVISLTIFFSNLLSFLFLFPYYSILSASPLRSITIQSLPFLLFFIVLEFSISYFFAISVVLASVFFIILFSKDPIILPVFSSVFSSSLFSFSFFCFCSFLCFLFALVSLLSFSYFVCTSLVLPPTD